MSATRLKLNKKKLEEAIHVPGATLIGSAHGYDLFKISTWEAAQEFVLESNHEHRGGESYTHDEGTFNLNINDQTNLYFFVLDNTNHIAGAAITGAVSSDIIVYSNDGDAQIRLPNINIVFENDRVTPNSIRAEYNDIPLYLIPGITLPENDHGIYAPEGTLVGVCACLTETTHLNQINLSEKNIWKVLGNAFTFGIKVDTVVIPDLTQDGRSIVLRDNAFKNVDNVLFSASQEEVDNFKTDNWERSWAGNASVEYDYGMTDEQRQLRREAKLRQEGERIINQINSTLETYSFTGDPFDYDRSEIKNILEDLNYTLNKVENTDEEVKPFISNVQENLQALIKTYEKALFDLEVYWFTRTVENSIPDNLSLDDFENNRDTEILNTLQTCWDWITKMNQDNTIFTQFKNQLPQDLIEKVKASTKRWAELKTEYEEVKKQRELNKLRYKIEKNHAVIKGTRKGITELDIPETIEGKPVTIIDKYAFYGNPDLRTVNIPKSLKRIEKAAFSECDNLNIEGIKRQISKLPHKLDWLAPDAFYKSVKKWKFNPFDPLI